METQHDKKIAPLGIMVMLSLILPYTAGNVLDNFHLHWVNLPFHALLETSGALMAFFLAVLITLTHQKRHYFSHQNFAILALLAMGTIDLFHAMQVPSNMFVWLHSLAVLVGGILFLSVWFSEKTVSRFVYYGLPFLALGLGVLLSVLSLLLPESIPPMLADGRFTLAAIMMNLVGGVAFLFAGLNFVYRFYLEEKSDDLMFAGLTFLFGISGLLFANSNLWDGSWWLWHVLRLIAYTIALLFAFKLFTEKSEALFVNEVKLKREKKKLGKALNSSVEYQKALEVGSVMTKGNLNGDIIYVNAAFCELTGYSEEELLGQPHSIFRHPNTPKEVYYDLWQTIKAKKVWKGRLKNVRKNGSVFYVNLTVVPVVNERGDLTEYLSFRENVTELVQSQEELRHIFYTDALTALNNRFKLVDELKEYRNPTLVLVNIDNFAATNDFYGHKVGDFLLVQLADFFFERVAFLPYKLYRVQGDEFALLVEKSAQPLAQTVEDTKKLLHELSHKTFVVNEQDITLSASAGIAQDMHEDVFLKADIALKHTRQERKELKVYDESMNIDMAYQENALWSNRIKRAIQSNMIVPYFQGIYDAKTQQLVKVEALLRLVEGDNVYPPFKVIDIAKKTRQYEHLTRIMVRKTLEHAINHPDLKFSINLCAEDIINTETRNAIKQEVEAFKSCSQIIFELVETEGIDTYSEVKDFIQWAKKCGAQIAIDDFGTGYSNFAYLMELEADIIKIDGSIIKGLSEGANGRALVKAIVGFAEENQMQTVAEFVSDENVLEEIVKLGVKQAQGFYLHMPTPFVPDAKD